MLRMCSSSEHYTDSPGTIGYRHNPGLEYCRHYNFNTNRDRIPEIILVVLDWRSEDRWFDRIGVHIPAIGTVTKQMSE